MTNPLEKYYRNRIAEMHVVLPSGGNYGGDINFSMAETVEVFALTAADEIYITNPDSLITGSAVERIISSCCPSIGSPRELPIQDVDAICLAAKKLSYGNYLKISGKCTKCEKEQEFKILIDGIFSKSTNIPNEVMCEVDGLKIYLKPYTLELANYISSKEFEENKLIETIQSSELSDEDKAKHFFNSIQKIKELNLNSTEDCIIRIITEDGTEVVNEDYISQFIQNASLKIIKTINDKIGEFSNYGLPATYEVKCSNHECNHHQEIPLIYDPTNFFE